MRLSALKRLVKSSTVVIPDNLINAKDTLIAVNLRACGPKINWPLKNKALRPLAALTTHSAQSCSYNSQCSELLLQLIISAQSIQSHQLSVKCVRAEVYFGDDIAKMFKTVGAEIFVSLNALNKVIKYHRISFKCPPLLFNTLVDTLLQLKSPSTVQKERLLVLWITKYQSRQISDDSSRLIDDYLY